MKSPKQPPKSEKKSTAGKKAEKAPKKGLKTLTLEDLDLEQVGGGSCCKGPAGCCNALVETLE